MEGALWQGGPGRTGTVVEAGTKRAGVTETVTVFVLRAEGKKARHLTNGNVVHRRKGS